MVERLKQLVSAFEMVRVQYKASGATESEPGDVFRSLLDAAVNGKRTIVPTTAEEWKLRDNRSHYEDASRDLFAAATACVEFIRTATGTMAEAMACRRWVRVYCWK